MAVAITMPRGTDAAAADSRPGVPGHRRGLRRVAGTGHAGNATAARASDAAGRYLAADAVSPRADRLRSALPDGQAAELLESAEPGLLPDQAIEIIAARANQRPAPLTLVVTFQMGGAINRVGATETAYAERSAPWMSSIDGNWENPPTTRRTSPGCARASVRSHHRIHAQRTRTLLVRPTRARAHLHPPHTAPTWSVWG